MLTGCVFLDNHNIQGIRLKSLRRHVGLVSQDIVSDCSLHSYILVPFYLFFYFFIICRLKHEIAFTSQQ